MRGLNQMESTPEPGRMRGRLGLFRPFRLPDREVERLLAAGRERNRGMKFIGRFRSRFRRRIGELHGS